MEVLILLMLISSLHAQSDFDSNVPPPPPGTVDLTGLQGLGDVGLASSTSLGNTVLTTDLKPTTKIIYTPELRATMKEFGITEAKLKEMLDQQRQTGKPTNLTIEEDGGEKIITWDFSQLRSAGVIDDATLKQLEGVNSVDSSSSSVATGSSGVSGASLLKTSALGGLSRLLNAQPTATDSKSVRGDSITRETSSIGGGIVTRDSSLTGRGSIIRDSDITGGGGILRDSGITRVGDIPKESSIIGSAAVSRDSGLVGRGIDSGLVSGTSVARDSGLIGGSPISRDRDMLRGVDISRDRGIGIRDSRLTTGGGLMQLVDEMSPRLLGGSVSTASGVVRNDGIGAVPSGIDTISGVYDPRTRVVPSTPGADPHSVGSGTGEFVMDDLHRHINDLIGQINQMHKDLFAKTLKLTDQEYAAEEAKIKREEEKLVELLRREKEISQSPGFTDSTGRPRDMTDVVALEADRKRQSILREIENIQNRNRELLRSLNNEARDRARRIEGLGPAPLDPRPPRPSPADRRPPQLDLDQRLPETSPTSARRVLDREIIPENRARQTNPELRRDPRISSEALRRLEMEREALRRDYERLQTLLDRRRRENGPFQSYPRMTRRPQMIQGGPTRRPGSFRQPSVMERERYDSRIPIRLGQRGDFPIYDPYYMYRREMIRDRRRESSTAPRNRVNNGRSTSSRPTFSTDSDVLVTEMRNDGMYDNAIPRPYPTFFLEPTSNQYMIGSSGFSSASSGMVAPRIDPYVPMSSTSRFVRRTDANPIFLRGASTINYLPGQTSRSRSSF